MYLKDRANKAGQCWPGVKRIASDLHLSVSTVKRAMKDLEKHNYIERLPRYRDNGSRSSNMYTLK